jgi:hypothetical protein
VRTPPRLVKARVGALAGPVPGTRRPCVGGSQQRVQRVSRMAPASPGLASLREFHAGIETGTIRNWDWVRSGQTRLPPLAPQQHQRTCPGGERKPTPRFGRIGRPNRQRAGRDPVTINLMLARVALLSLLSLSAFAAEPCTSAKPECTEWVRFGAGPSRSLIYRTHSLETRDERIVRALVIVHGMDRDADDSFRIATAAAFLAGALEDTVVIAPRFASAASAGCRDALAPGELNWPCDSWRSGGAALNNDDVTSFDFMDRILRQLASRQAFPNLKVIVVTGHSAGGQYAERYAMGNTVHERLGVPVRYVVSNPSSYAYLDKMRPNADGSAFGPYTGARCAAYNRWPYGLEKRAGYTAKLSEEQLRKQIASRPVSYLLGELDTLPLGGFDSSCAAMAQGRSRRARGEAWVKYVNAKLDADQREVKVPMCGHNARCMYTSDEALPLLFPQP